MSTVMVTDEQLAQAKRILDGREWLYYGELSDKAKERVHCNYTVSDDWHDYVLEELTSMLEDIGVLNAEISYSGFSSQGDGAHFTGSYRYAKGATAEYKKDRPRDTELHGILDALQDLQRRHFYKLTAEITHHGGYQHEYCALVDAEVAEEELTKLLRDLMRCCYKRLSDEYDYCTGEGMEEMLMHDKTQYNEDGSWYGS